MKKHTTVLFLCGLFLLADYIWFGQTLEARANLSQAVLMSLIWAQAVAAVLIVSLGLMILRKTYDRQKKPANRRSGFAIVQPLRRLFVSAWS